MENGDGSTTRSTNDNLRQMDVDVAIAEAKLFRFAGGGTICDVSSLGLGVIRRRYTASRWKPAFIHHGHSSYVASSWSEEEKAEPPRD